MKRKSNCKFNPLHLLYIIFGILSLLLIGLYWCSSFDESVRNVLMSTGASLIGAVLLGFFIELITKNKNKELVKDIVFDSINASKIVLEELDQVFSEFKKDTDIDFDFSSESDFMTKAMNTYLSLLNNRNPTDDQKAQNLKYAIYDDIVNKTFIITACENAVYAFKSILKSQNELISKDLLSKDIINLFNKASIKMSNLINESCKNRFSLLLSNNLNFREELEQIVGLLY